MVPGRPDRARARLALGVLFALGARAPAPPAARAADCDATATTTSSTTTATAATCSLPATGQPTCGDSSGSVIACAATGHDGDLRKGASFAYVDNGDGTITDVNTGLVTWAVSFYHGGVDAFDALPKPEIPKDEDAWREARRRRNEFDTRWRAHDPGGAPTAGEDGRLDSQARSRLPPRGASAAVLPRGGQRVRASRVLDARRIGRL